MDFAATAERPAVERWIGPLPGLKEARAISVLALIAGAVLCALSLYFGFRGETFMGRPLGGDFVQFYAAGKILNSGPPTAVYDIAAIVRTEHESLPAMPDTQMLLFGNAPYIAALFRPLALLQYRYAYCVWLAISFLLYFGGLVILIGDRLPRTAYLMALSAPMFLLETWIGGRNLRNRVPGHRAVRRLLPPRPLGPRRTVAIDRRLQTVVDCHPGRDADRRRVLASRGRPGGRIGAGGSSVARYRRHRRLYAMARYAARLRKARHRRSSVYPAHQVRRLQFVFLDSARSQWIGKSMRADRHTGSPRMARARLVDLEE